ncbi:GNAT family N-acetyltransferase [Microvirga sp. HBU67558]|uniref:acyl-homoserine-lactone synthase n=1 Tax=Microvirga TaxID=186650 RepID=UPI001B36E596|nr:MULTISPECIES: acyl-homoserine-lactone synthase [unclassified Microvirga]MBQ0821132.1 GNAT family N-acetyltransferase [Microvirga sp. HBU67558]
MTTIQVITRDNKAGYSEILDEYFQLRHQVFVEERGWQTLRRPDGREMDSYDNDHATYLVALDKGRVIGGLRLYPTLLPHMISETFPHLLRNRSVLRGPSVLECTRYFIVKERRTGRTDCRLLAAFQQFCLEEDVTEVTAIVEMWWLPRWHQAGFRARPLGLPTTIEGQPCIAAAIQISEASLEHVSRLAGLHGSFLSRMSGVASYDERVPHVAA